MKSSNDNKTPKKSHTRKFMQFTSAGAQMLITVLVGKYLGEYLDATYRPNEKEAFYEQWLSLAFVILAMTSLIVKVLRISNQEEENKSK